jgi:hypothetical protein
LAGQGQRSGAIAKQTITVTAKAVVGWRIPLARDVARAAVGRRQGDTAGRVSRERDHDDFGLNQSKFIKRDRF